MEPGKTYQVVADEPIDKLILEGKDGPHMFFIDPITVKKGELVTYETNIVDHEIMGPEDENGDIPVRNTTMEVTYKILSNSNKVRKKFRYVDVRGIAPIFKVKKDLVTKNTE